MWAPFSRRIPLGRLGQPEDVAAPCAFLAADLRRLHHGQSLQVDGGMLNELNQPSIRLSQFLAQGRRITLPATSAVGPAHGHGKTADRHVDHGPWQAEGP